MTQKSARLIAFYLPQYHPIPENDEWWGKGFTEWTNVARARPLFPGHYQPHIPADLGFYDLRVPEVREQQAELARQAGIEGFCYWHYWFGGKRLLERPFEEVLASGKPDFPFCLAWANQTWSGIWHGSPEKILIAQTYPGKEDYEAHFFSLLRAFQDSRYLKVDGKPIFILLRPTEIPSLDLFICTWRELAAHQGLPGIYFVGVAEHDQPLKALGYDAGIIDNPWVGFKGIGLFKAPGDSTAAQIPHKIRHAAWFRLLRLPHIYSYRRFFRSALPDLMDDFDQYPCVVPNWDNTPRSGRRGVVLLRSTPAAYNQFLRGAIAQVRLRQPDKRLVFIKSWNEWAEGNYLEPDLQFGDHYFRVTREQVYRV